MSHGYGGQGYANQGHGAAAPGWHPDPWRLSPLRWWDGASWTAWQSDGRAVWGADGGVGPAGGAGAGSLGAVASPVVGVEHLESLRFVEEVFLAEARRRGVAGEPQLAALTDLSRRLAAEARGDVAGHRPAGTTTSPIGSPFGAPGAGAAVDHPGYAVASGYSGYAASAGYASPTGHAASSGHAGAGHVAAPDQAVSAGASVGTATGYGTVPGVGAPPREPGRVARWWAELRQRSDADLTVHGLAYLGVLLLFVGVFGLVAFAFSDVSPQLRPVAELAVAAVPFVGAWLLARSGARFVARTLVAVGGLLLPVMVVTSTVDGFHVPPDAHGAALPVVTGSVIAALAVGYALWTRRRPSSGLGVMVAPVAWFAAGMAAVGLGRPVPRGEDVAVPGGAQVAVIALAVLLTTALARGRSASPGPVAQRALAAVGPGTVVVGTLALVAAVAEGWPVLPVVVTVLALCGAVAVSGRFGPTTTQVTLVVGWAVVAVLVLAAQERTPLLSPDVPVVGAVATVRPWLLLAVVLLGVGLAEVLVRRWRGDVPAAVLLVGTVLVVIAHAGAGQWWTVAAAAVLSVWAGWRRTTVGAGAAASSSADGDAGASVPAVLDGPTGRPVLAGMLDVVAALAPALLVVGVWGIAPGAVALLVAAGLVLLVVPLARGRLARAGAGAESFWRWWTVAAVPVVLVAGAGQLAACLPLDDAGASAGGPVLLGLDLATGSVPISAALVGAAVVLGPWRATVRVAAVTPIAWWTWLTACLLLEAPTAVAPVGLAVGGLLAVGVAQRGAVRGAESTGARSTGTGPVAAGPVGAGPVGTAAAVGLAGHLTGVVAVVATLGAGVELVVALAAATLGWGTTAVLGERGRSAVAAALDRGGVLGRSMPWVLVLIGLPMTVAAAGHVSGVLPVADPWSPATLAGTALVYAVASRLVRSGGRVRLARLLPGAAFTAAVLGVLAPWTTWTRVVALAVLVLQVLVTRGRRRVMVWTAWVALTPLVVLVARDLVPTTRDLGGAAVLSGTFVGLGGLLVVGALVVDRARPGDPRWRPRRPGALAPTVLGAVQVPLGVLAAGFVPDAFRAGVLLAVAAVVTLLVAVLSGIGTVAGLAVLVGWVATFPLLGTGHPGAWLSVAVTAAMLLAAQGASTIATRPGAATGTVAGAERAEGAGTGAGAVGEVGTAAARVGQGRPAWACWDVPLAVAAAVPALGAVASATTQERPALLVVVGALAVAVAVRLHRRRVLSEVLGWVGTVLVLAGAAVTPGWTAVAFAVLAAAHTTLAAWRETGTVRTVRQWVGALAVVPAWFATLVAVVPGPQEASDLTAVVAGTMVLGVVGAGAAGHLHRSWVAAWGTVGTVTALAGLVALVPSPRLAARRWADDGVWAAFDLWTDVVVSPSWWHVAAWLALAGAAVLTTRALPWGWGREVGALGVLAAVGTGFSVLGVTATVRVTTEVVLSVAAAVALVLVARAGAQMSWRRPLTVLGAGALVLAAGSAAVAGARDAPSLLVAVLAAVAVQVAATGVAWRSLGLRLAAPVVGWFAWAVYAADARDEAAGWYTVPVGLALLVVVAVWRADRRDRGLPAREGGVVALELTGVAFLVVASFVAAFTTSVLHALVAAGIGVLVTLWGLVTRVRRRLFTGVGIVLVGVVLAVALPLVALLPAWGEAGVWVLVAVVGVLAVLAATLVERGRVAVRDGRARLLDVTRGWE